MQRIDRLILRAYIGPFVLSFSLILLILVIQFMSLYMDEILDKGLGPMVLLQLFFYASGRLVLTALPVAVLAAALITYGNMGEYYELAALKSCGISLFQTMRSSIIFALLLTLGSLYFSFMTVPQANLKFFSLLYDVQRKKPDLALKAGYFYWNIDNYVIRVADKHPDNGMLYQVMIYDHTENRGNSDLILADSAYSFLADTSLTMVLYHGVRHQKYVPEGTRKNYPHGRTYFDSLYYHFALKGFGLERTDESQFRHQITLTQDKLGLALDSLDHVEADYIRKSGRQIARYTKVDSLFPVYGADTVAVDEPVVTIMLEPEDNIVDCLRGTKQPVELLNRALVNARAVKSYLDFMIKKKEDIATSDNSYRYEYYLRYALPLNCLVFMLIGVSLGAIIRRGGLGYPALVSIALFIVFYVLTTYGKKFAREGVMDAWVGAFLTVIALSPFALIVTYQATQDARIMDLQVWRKVLSLATLKKLLHLG